MTVLAILGAKALYLTYAWLVSAVVSAYLSERKGYGEKPGLAAGLLLNALGIVLWLVWPAKDDSRWKLQGAFGGGDKTLAEARAERAGTSPADGGGSPPANREKP